MLLLWLLLLARITTTDTTRPVWTGEQDLLEVVAASPVDLGQRRPGAQGVRWVRLRNTSSDTLHLEVVRKTCGCVEANFEPAVLPPGEVAELRLTVRIDAVIGPQQHAVEFRATTAGEPVREELGVATVAYTPFLEISVYPPEIVLRAASGERVSRRLFVVAAPDVTLPRLSARTTLPGVTVADSRQYLAEMPVLRAARRPSRVGGDTRDLGTQVLDVALEVVSPGEHEGSIEVLTPEGRVLATVPVRVVIDEPLLATPPGIVLTDDRPDAVRRTIAIASRGVPMSPENLRVRSDAAGIRATLRERGDLVSLDVEADLAALRGRTRRFDIHVIEGERVLLTIPVVVYHRPAMGLP